MGRGRILPEDDGWARRAGRRVQEPALSGWVGWGGEEGSSGLNRRLDFLFRLEGDILTLERESQPPK